MNDVIVIHNDDDVRVNIEEDGTFNVIIEEDDINVIVEAGEKGDPGVKLTISATEPVNPEYKEIWFQI